MQTAKKLLKQECVYVGGGGGGVGWGVLKPYLLRFNPYPRPVLPESLNLKISFLAQKKYFALNIFYSQNFLKIE